VHEWIDGKLRPVLIRRLGLPVRAFMAYVQLIGIENKEIKRANQSKGRGKRLK